MIGIVIPDFTADKFFEIFKINTDKNYITPTEIAALADNNLLEINARTIRNMLVELGVPLDNEYSGRVIRQAISIALFAREA